MRSRPWLVGPRRVLTTLDSLGRRVSGLSRRGLLAGSIGAAVAAGLAVAAVLGFGGGAEDPPSASRSSPSATQPSPTVVGPSPAATRPSSRQGVGSSGASTRAGSCTGSCEAASTEQVDAGEDGSWSAAGPLLGAAGVLLAAGALWKLRRHLQRRRSRQPADRVGEALVHLAGNVRPRDGDGYPQPRVVRVSDGRIDVLLSQPDPSPPPPWRPEGFGLAWVLDADVPLPPTEEAPPLPALVTIGTTDSDIVAGLEADGGNGTTEADILVDLEAYGVVALVGDEDTCRGMARAIAGELSTRAQGLAAVEVIGDPLDDATARLDGVDRHESWDDLDTATIDTSARLLDTGGWPHTWAARSSGRIDDGWPPTVWITERSQESRYLDTLDAIATRPGAGSALVVVGHDPGRGLRIHLDDQGRFNIPDLNLRGKAHTPTPTAPAAPTASIS
jgi:hypothetical protein